MDEEIGSCYPSYQQKNLQETLDLEKSKINGASSTGLFPPFLHRPDQLISIPQQPHPTQMRTAATKPEQPTYQRRSDGAIYFGNPASAIPATHEQRISYQLILLSLENEKGMLEKINYEQAKSTIELIHKFHRENLQVCLNLFQKFNNGEQNYNVYDLDSRIVVPCNKDDMVVEKRAITLYEVLLTSYKLARKTNTLKCFFTSAFTDPSWHDGCIECIQAQLIKWYEDEIRWLASTEIQAPKTK